MITQKYKLNIIPSFNGPVVVKCSQYDKDSRSIEFSLFDGANQFVLDSNYTVTVRGTKKDGTAFEYDCSIEDDKAVFLLNQQMTLFDGKYLCELRIINGAEILGSSNFTLFVEKSPIDENSVISESDLPAYEKLLNDLQGEKISDWLEENITQETGYVLDSSLTVQGAAADAKAVGNALAILEEKIDDGGSSSGLTDEIAQALLACFQNVAWINADGQDYYTDLEEALANARGVQYTVTNLLSQCTNSNNSIKATEGKKYIAALTANPGYTLSAVTVTMGGIDVTGTYYSGGTISIPNVTGNIVITAVATSFVSSITAVFTQGENIIYANDSLDSLKQYLVVTANYSGGSSAVLPDSDYLLSGELTEGTSTITVSYGGKTDTFTVVVSERGLPSGYEAVEYIFNPNGSASGPVVDTGVKLSGNGDVVIETSFMAYGSESTPYVIGCLSSTSSNTIGLGISLQDNYASIIVFSGTIVGINPQTVKGVKHNITATVTSNGASITDGTLSTSGSFTPRVHNVANIYLFGIKKATTNEVNYPFTGRIYSVKVTENNIVKMELVPCVRLSDGMAGFWDYVNDNFVYHSSLVAAPSEHNTTAEIEFPRKITIWQSNAPVLSSSSANNGTTKKYSIDATTSLYPAGILPYKYHSGASGNLNDGANIVIYDNGGNAISHVNVSASPARWAQTSNYTEYSNEWTVSAYTDITFDVSMEYLHDSYMYDKTTGQVFFAGRNTPYYGMSNISEAGGS